MLELKWIDATSDDYYEVIHISSQHLVILAEALTISPNYSRLSICQMFLFYETLLQLCFLNFPLIFIKEWERWIGYLQKSFCWYKFGMSPVLKKVLKTFNFGKKCQVWLFEAYVKAWICKNNYQVSNPAPLNLLKCKVSCKKKEL